MWSHLWLSGYYIIVIVCAHIKLICCAEGGELVPRFWFVRMRDNGRIGISDPGISECNVAAS